MFDVYIERIAKAFTFDPGLEGNLDNPEWNNTTVISGNVAEEVSKLKQEPGQDILVAGSGQLVHTLTELGLVDEYRFMVHPIVLGSGKRLFHSRNVFKFADTKQFSSGVVVLTYQAGPKEGSEPVATAP